MACTGHGSVRTRPVPDLGSSALAAAAGPEAGVRGVDVRLVACHVQTAVHTAEQGEHSSLQRVCLRWRREAVVCGPRYGDDARAGAPGKHALHAPQQALLLLLAAAMPRLVQDRAVGEGLRAGWAPVTAQSAAERRECARTFSTPTPRTVSTKAAQSTAGGSPRTAASSPQKGPRAVATWWSVSGASLSAVPPSVAPPRTCSAADVPSGNARSVRSQARTKAG